MKHVLPSWFRVRPESWTLFAVAFVPWASFHPAQPLKDDAKLPIRVAAKADCSKGVDFQAALAVTMDRRVLGLGHRVKKLRPNEAMLFIFEEAHPVEIWMRDTLIPLGVSFFDADGKVTATYDMPVDKNPSQAETRYPSMGDVLTALEYSPRHFKTIHQGPRFLCVKPPKP